MRHHIRLLVGCLLLCLLVTSGLGKSARKKKKKRVLARIARELNAVRVNCTQVVDMSAQNGEEDSTCMGPYMDVENCILR